MKNLKIRRILISAFFMVVLTATDIYCQNFAFDQHPIDLSFQGIHAIKVIDLDADGDFDIVAGSEQTPTTSSIGLHWLRNDGGNPIVWTRIPIDASFEHVMSVDVANINNDNYPDIVASSWSLNQIAWWRNSGDPTQGWTKYLVRSNFINAHDAKCADIDEDGDTDIISANKTTGGIIISLNDGSSTVNWQTSYLTNSFAGALRVLVSDLDKDNDLDILGTASDAGEIAWWENMGNNPITWTMHIIATNFPGSSDLFVIDINDDQVNDVIANAWSSNQVAYWVCDDLQNNSWTKYTVSNTLEVAAKVSAEDFDNDNDIDIVAVGKIPGELAIYKNTNFTWSKIVLANSFYGGTALEVIDFDNDTDLDIIAGASSLGELYWWENMITTSVTNNDENLVQYHLFQNYPNPFNPTTTIKYQIPELSFVTVKVYGLLGNEIARIVSEEKEAGNHSVEFSNDGSLTSGMYFYTLVAGDFTQTKKMILLK